MKLVPGERLLMTSVTGTASPFSLAAFQERGWKSQISTLSSSPAIGVSMWTSSSQYEASKNVGVFQEASPCAEFSVTGELGQRSGR